jgi:hypothetical protein
MAIVIQPYRPEHEPAVADFNRRLQVTSDPSLVFYKTSVPQWLPRLGDHPLYNEYFVAVDAGIVRGAYALKHERVFVPGKGDIGVACYHHPLSEGIVNRGYAAVGASLLRDALVRQPLLYALGMGGYDRPLAKMLKAVGFSLAAVPFFFKVLHPSRFLREMQALRTSPLRRILMDTSAATGVGWLALHAAQNAKRARSLLSSNEKADAKTDTNVDRIPEFASWADSLWLRARPQYRMTAIRDSTILQRLYPAADGHFSRLRIRRNEIDIGWAVVGERRKDSKYGSLTVGSIVDGWASPENALAVMQAATRELEAQNVDLIVSNQSDKAWGRALESCGFFKGPSNFIFAASKKYAELLHPFAENSSAFHITRADGDGLPRNF